MKLEWDEAKDAANLAKHGIAFADAALVFERPWFQVRSDRYGEARWIAVGVHPSGRVLAVVFTRRNDKIRLISARRARDSEATTYRKAIAQNTDER